MAFMGNDCMYAFDDWKYRGLTWIVLSDIFQESSFIVSETAVELFSAAVFYN